MVVQTERVPRCWCGTRNPYYSPEPFRKTCGGLGVIDCLCGGGLCVCHHHGEVECDGCEDCDDDEDFGDGF